MQNLITFFIILLSFTATGQTWSAEIDKDAGLIIITDTATPHCCVFAEEWEYVLRGDCYILKTDRFQPGQGTYTIDLPPELEDGFLLQKVNWYLPTQTGGWSRNTSYCMSRTIPPPDTIIMEPLEIQAIYGQPNWWNPVGNPVEWIPTSLQPQGVKVEWIMVTSVNGVVAHDDYLAPGTYYYQVFMEWQDMPFMQSGQIYIY